MPGRVITLTPASLNFIAPLIVPSPPITIKASILLSFKFLTAFLKLESFKNLGLLLLFNKLPPLLILPSRTWLVISMKSLSIKPSPSQ